MELVASRRGGEHRRFKPGLAGAGDGGGGEVGERCGGEWGGRDLQLGLSGSQKRPQLLQKLLVHPPAAASPPTRAGCATATLSPGYLEVYFRIVLARMGRKAGALYINPKKFGGVTKPCMIEMVSFLNCLALNKQNDDKCVRQKDLLVACAQAQKGRPKNAAKTINYHLQRLARDKGI
uniref:IMS import disulfide relay-system CHCH-CHCH-like Cx9C domain-containing protein n=1 Tax=Oryza glumipatula TaxID=40148 RepID=A0A0D9Z5C7_9ORYZ